MGYAPSAINKIYPPVEKHEPSTRRGGIYALKPGYHSSRRDNQRRWPGDYSIICPADREGPATAAGAIDITLSYEAMPRVTKRLIDACRDNDPRMGCVREVIGTLNHDDVVVYNRVSTGRGSRSRTGLLWNASDDSHLWHVHISILRRYVADAQLMLGIAEVAAGVPAGTYSGEKPAKVEKPKKPKRPAGKTVVRYTTEWGTEGWDGARPGEIKHVRARGFRARGVVVELSDGKYVQTAWGTLYAFDHLSEKKQGIPAKQKPVSLAAVRSAARKDPKRPQGAGGKATADDVRMVETALRAEGTLPKKYASDGSFGTATRKAYRQWQQKLGYSGRDADGIPGKDSLTKLGKKYGFKVHAHD